MHIALPKILPLILFVALVVRCLFLGADGFHNDVQTFEAWALTLRDQPLSSFYAQAGFADYPPGYLYVLTGLARLYSVIGAHDSGYSILRVLMKLPGILCDLLNAWLAFCLVRRFVTEKIAVITAACVAFNPAFLFISAYWGQVDAVAASFVLLSLLALDRGIRRQWHPLAVGVMAWSTLALSVLIKPPALLLAPLLLAWPLALWKTSTWAARRLRILATVLGIGSALLLTYILALPFAPVQSFGGVAQWLLQRYAFGSNVYPYNTINAFNIYAISQPFWEPDSHQLFSVFPIHQSTLGAILVVMATLAFAWRFVQIATPLAAIEAATLTLFSFFVLATRMHERYIFDAVLLLIITGALLRRYRWLALATTITLFCNLFYSLYYLQVMTTSVAGVDPRNLMPWLSRPCALLNTGLAFFAGMTFLGAFDDATSGQPIHPTWALFEAWCERSWQGARRWFDQHIRQLNDQEGCAAFTRLDWWMSIGLSVASFVLCVINYAYPNEKIFDEIYYARSGEEYLKHIGQFEWTHPPLTKLIITASMLLFGGMHGGDTSAGWRFGNVVVGALMVGVLYAFAKRLSGSTLFASIAAGFLVFDGFHFAQSRIATPEITVAFFCLLTLYTFYRFWLASDAAPEVRAPLTARLSLRYGIMLCGALVVGVVLARFTGILPGQVVPVWLPAVVLCLYAAAGGYTLLRLLTSQRSRAANGWLLALTVSAGCLAACKWNGLFDFFVVWFFALVLLAARWIPQLKAFGNSRVLPLDLLCTSMLFVASSIYVLSYIPYFLLGNNFFDLLILQQGMYAYHADLRATHPYSSLWWQWPILQRPISYYYHDFRTGLAAAKDSACCVAEILALPNPLVWWLGLVSVPVVAVLGWVERRRGYCLLIIAYLFQWLPWIASPRIAFEYHFFPNLAIICCCDALLLQRLWLYAGPRASLRTWPRLTVCAILAAALAAFVFWYPIVSATGMTYAQWSQRVLTWLPFVHWI